MIPPANRQTLTRCVLKVELGKPIFFLLKGQETARSTYGNVGRGESEEAKAVL
jgi:hypothetical protein